MKNSESAHTRIQVWRLVRYDRRPGPRHGSAIYQRFEVSVRPIEANILVWFGAAIWRTKAQLAIDILIPVNKFLQFVGMMRYTKEAHPVALDSRTHKRLRPTAFYPMAFDHIRNGSYSDLERHKFCLWEPPAESEAA